MIQQEKNNTFIHIHFREQGDSQIRQSEFISIPDLKERTQNNLPESESNKKQNVESQVWSQQRVNKKLQKLTNFINFHNVEEESIWKRKREVSVQQFATFMKQNYSYFLSPQQLSALIQITSRKNSLTPKDFQRFNIWKQQNQNCVRFFSTNNLQKTQNVIPKKSVNTKDTQNSTGYLNLSKASSQSNLKPQFHINKSNVKFSIKPRKDFNQESFQQAKKYSEAKVKLQIEELKKDIKESVLQKKWDFIVMAGQMNQWINQLKKVADKQFATCQLEPIFSYRYKVVNKDPVVIIQQNVDLETQEQIPHVVFGKKYQTLKKRMVKEENNKNNLKGTVLMVLEDNDKLNKTNLNNRINQRDQELNFDLLQIMRMKSLFQWQNKILKQTKINS